MEDQIGRYWDENIRPLVEEFPEDILLTQRAAYIRDVQENPEAYKQLQDHVSRKLLRSPKI